MNTSAGARDGEEHAGERRSGEHGDALDPAGDGVRRCQLLGRARERRRQRGLRRAERRRRDGGRDRESRTRPTGRRRRRRATAAAPTSDDPGDVREQEHPLPRIAVAEHARERRDERGRDQPGEEDEPDGLLAADAVRVDGDRDEERVVADDRCGPGELEPAQVRVPPDGRERAEQSPRAACRARSRAEHLTGPCRMKGGRGKISSTVRGLVG